MRGECLPAASWTHRLEVARQTANRHRTAIPPLACLPNGTTDGRASGAAVARTKTLASPGWHRLQSLCTGRACGRCRPVHGEVAEWLNAAVSKTVGPRLVVPRVRIPPSPLRKARFGVIGPGRPRPGSCVFGASSVAVRWQTQQSQEDRATGATVSVWVPYPRCSANIHAVHSSASRSAQSLGRSYRSVIVREEGT